MSLQNYRNWLNQLEQLGFKALNATENEQAMVMVKGFLMGTLVNRNRKTHFPILLLQTRKDKADMNHSSVKNNALSYWKNNVSLDITSEGNQIYDDLHKLRCNLESYTEKVKKTYEFKMLPLHKQNAYILPFYVASYEPKICSAMLPHNIDATNVLVRLLHQEIISSTDLNLFKDLSEETLGAFID